MRVGLTEVPTLNGWLQKNMTTGSSVGIDAFLQSTQAVKSLKSDLNRVGVSLITVGMMLLVVVAVLLLFSLFFLFINSIIH